MLVIKDTKLLELIEAYWKDRNHAETTLIVRIKHKYENEIGFSYDNEIVQYDFTTECWYWLKDWYEGQQVIHYLGVIGVSEIDKFFTIDKTNDCSLCHKYGLEKNDRLYQCYHHDNSIEYEELRIKYCPLCGKLLKEDNT